jgi:hypothetical protein
MGVHPYSQRRVPNYHGGIFMSSISRRALPRAVGWCTAALSATALVATLAPTPAVASLVGPPAPTIAFVTEPSGAGKPIVFRLESASTDVAVFRYGLIEPPLNEAPATVTDTATATVSVTPGYFGSATLYAQAVNAEGQRSPITTLEFVVPRPNPAVAWWVLGTLPGFPDPAAALSDQNPALAGDTPLIATDVSWAADVRALGTTSATLNGVTSDLTAQAAIDTSGSFAVAAFVQLSDLGGRDTIVAQEGTQTTAFKLQYRGEDRNGDGVRDPSWCLFTNGADATGSASTSVCAVGAAQAKRWTHVAGSYDAAAGKLQVYVDGVLRAEAAAPAPFAAAETVRVGAARTGATKIAERLQGSVEGIRMYDRALLPEDLTGSPDDSGVLTPYLVGSWDFSGAVPCYEEGIENTCEAPDGAAWGRRLALSEGADIGGGQRGNALVLNGVHWIDDPSDPHYGVATLESGRSQRMTSAPGEPPVFQDAPVLLTGQSYTVSAWVRLAATDRSQTVVTQDSDGVGAFKLGFDPVNGGQWVFDVRGGQSAGPAKSVVAAAPAADPGAWHHLVAVLDRATGAVRLHVNGELVATTPLGSWKPWQANGPLQVGREKTTSGPTGWLDGAVGDLLVYQSALTTADVSDLYEDQHVG